MRNDNKKQIYEGVKMLNNLEYSVGKAGKNKYWETHQISQAMKPISAATPEGIPIYTAKPMILAGQQHPVLSTMGTRRKLKFNITRETNNILLDIPFAMWAPVSITDNYVSVFEQTKTFVPAGTVVFSIDPVRGDGLITWTVGANTDVIRIHCTGLTTYSQRLSMIQSGGSFTSSGIRYGANPNNFTAQYNAFEIFGGSSNFYGTDLDSSEDVDGFKGPDQFQNPIIDVAMNFAIDYERYIVHGFPNDPLVSPNTINWNFFDVDYQSSAAFANR